MLRANIIHLHFVHLADTFIQSDLQRLIQTLTHRRWSQPCKATAISSGAVRQSAQGHINTQLEGAGDRTATLLKANQPTSAHIRQMDFPNVAQLHFLIAHYGRIRAVHFKPIYVLLMGYSLESLHFFIFPA